MTAPWPSWPLAVNVGWAVDDFTAENGATRVVPGSLQAGRGPEWGQDYPEAIALTCPAGSIFVMDGRVWHQTGPNTTQNVQRIGMFAVRRAAVYFTAGGLAGSCFRRTPWLREVLGCRLRSRSWQKSCQIGCYTKSSITKPNSSRCTTISWRIYVVSSKRCVTSKDDEWFGSGQTKSTIETHQRHIGELYRELILCGRARSCGWQLLCAFPGEEVGKAHRRQDIQKSLERLSADGEMLTETDALIRKKIHDWHRWLTRGSWRCSRPTKRF